MFYEDRYYLGNAHTGNMGWFVDKITGRQLYVGVIGTHNMVEVLNFVADTMREELVKLIETQWSRDAQS